MVNDVLTFPFTMKFRTPVQPTNRDAKRENTEPHDLHLVKMGQVSRAILGAPELEAQWPLHGGLVVKIQQSSPVATGELWTRGQDHPGLDPGTPGR